MTPEFTLSLNIEWQGTEPGEAISGSKRPITAAHM